MKKIVAILLSVVMVGTLASQTPVYAASETADAGEKIEAVSSTVLDESEESLPAEVGFAAGTSQEESSGQEPQVAMFSARAAVAEGNCGVSATWALADGTLTISGTGEMADYEVDDNNVCTAPWYGYASSIQNIVIGSGITSVGQFAFYNLTNVTSVSIADSVTAIEKGAFCECSAITAIALPASVTTLGEGAFSRCKSLASFTGTGIKEISDYAFESASFVSFTVPASVTEIGEYAFLYNTQLTSVTIPEGVTSVGKLAFYGCNSLKAVTVPKTVTFVHPLAFPAGTAVTCLNTALTKYADTGYRYLEEVSISVSEDYSMAYQVLDLVNAERTKNGLSKLVMNQSLMDSAMDRAGETAVFFSHTRPDGTSCFTINSLMIAENIAMGQTTAQEVMTAWLNSSGHKANILDPDATSIGIGCVKHNGYYYWTQCFGTTSDTASCAKPSNQTVNQKISLALESFGDATANYYDMYDVNEGSYKFEPLLNVENKKVAVGSSTSTGIYIINPGYALVSAKLNSTGITWSSDNTKVATVDSSGNVKAVATGSANITAKMKHFTLSTPFVLGVRRVYGKNRYETAFATANTLKTTMGVSKFDTIIVATGTAYADALSGSYLAYVKDAPILLVSSSYETKVKEYIKSNLNTGGTVYILGGTSAVAASMESGLSGYTVKRLSGSNRFETNVAILKEAGVTSDELVVCTGTNYADSLSCSSIGKPMMLVKGNSLSATQAAYVKSLSPDSIYIIGGTSAVSAKMATALGSYCSNVERIGGSSRYETSVLVANEFFDAPSSIVLAYSLNFPDGLCGGPLAAKLNAPMIITATYQESVAAYYADVFGIGSGIVLGGSGLISDDAVRNVFGLGSSGKITVVK